jgi:uncharacterized protein (DUF1778 family)
MIESARRPVIDVPVDRRLFALDSDRYDAFMHALDNPPRQDRSSSRSCAGFQHGGIGGKMPLAQVVQTRRR